MAGIGPITGGLPVGFLTGPSGAARANGSTTADALGTKSGLGESVSTGSGPDEDSNSARGISSASRNLSEEEQQEVDELQRRDREVRQHEQAHVAAAGRYAQGGPQFEFTTGPDGRQYATGGHVNIDVSPASTPEATIQKAQVVRRAALAPAEPSGQDRAVAAEASQLELKARRELREAQQGDGEDRDGAEAPNETEGVSGEVGGVLQPPPVFSQREYAQYQPDAAGEPSGAGGIAGGVGRLDVSV